MRALRARAGFRLRNQLCNSGLATLVRDTCYTSAPAVLLLKYLKQEEQAILIHIMHHHLQYDTAQFTAVSKARK